MRYRFRLLVISFIVVLALCTAGCRQVSEDSSDLSLAPVVIPATGEEFFQPTVSETVETEAETGIPTGNDTEIITETASETAETAEISEMKNGNMEITEKSTEISEIKTEIIAQTAQVSQTTKLTLQYESPREITEIRTEMEEKMEIQTVSASQTPYKPYKKNTYSALNFDEQKGFWITYLEYASILKNKSEASFRKSVGEYFDNISDLGFNTVYVQVRAFGDAYYDSELFPSGEQFDGTIGTKNKFDALQVMIECAHERGISVHAWVNPMRTMTTSQIEKIDDSYTIKKWYNNKRGEYIVKSGDRWYLNPAYDEVTDLIAAGITEIAANYKVDGIQIDDYFYPTTDKSFDSAAYAEMGNGMSLSDWRIANVNKMVKKLYKAVHSANDTVVFGISPQGSVENNYGELYADVRKWCSESGYCDYILPQVYFGFDNAALPYADVISLWSGMVKTSDVKLVIGLAAYKVGAEDNYAGSSGKREWLENSDILARQMKLAKALGNYGGVALYRYDSVFNPTADVSAQVSKEIKNIEK
ncbi:MAG: family 10 glycosylhydrolase [Oscillospiraceae bacterium]|nr:family 10 glycosylhydrolase [Oscillospiraceae bacterium]